MTLPVLITRPGSRGAALAEALRREGSNVEVLDVMQLQALPEDAAMRQVWLDIDQYHKIVVISPFAADCLSEALDRYWPQLPIGIDYYSVGQSTAAMLYEQLGVRVHVPPSSDGEDTSESLLRLASLQALSQQRVLIVAGEGGRSLLADTLAERGARVTPLAVYRRRLLAPTGPMQARLAAGNYRALIVTSGELLEHLAKWCQPAALNQPLIVSSRRLATLAERLGFCAPIVASGATPPALIAALART
ncbi:uroporphyrinogen-III synthase [Halomonas sp. HL-93]|nr:MULTISPECIES: uroporphyrinogen-III synthase [unclassified Halomonas]KPQ30938.1 MAG: uroporphyrinogen-III synthase HemD [Halomonas sp. HL-93]SBR44965.1 uroporphyrinogen-III synthase [Halomonas sp. HL-93]SNY97776.1 uroporphyrinogen-III synthase [Halomonas sp. hl-4]